MNILQKFAELLTHVEELVKGERRIVQPKVPYQASEPKDHEVSHGGVKGSDVTLHTGKVRYAPHESSDTPHDYVTHSEHVLVHKGVPVGIASVHHAHPLDKGRVKGGKVHENTVSVHAPSMHQDAHSTLKTRVHEHVNSPEFKHLVDEHNIETHGYEKPKFWMAGTKKPQKKD